MVTLPDFVGFDPIVLKGDKGDSGAKGDTGAAGATPNLTVGTVATLPAGQVASASISGTPANPILNLQLPAGSGPVSSVDGLIGTIDLTTKYAALPVTRNTSTAVMQDEVSPSAQRYGAKGDGTTDDTAALQALFNAGLTAVRVPRGTYNVSSALTVPYTVTNVDLTGAVLRATATIAGPMLTWGDTTHRLQDASLSGGYLDCNGLAASGLSVPYFWGVRIIDVTVHNVTGNAVLVGDPAAPTAGVEMKMRGVKIDRDPTGANATVPTGSYGLWMRNVTDSYFEDVTAVGADISFRNDGGSNTLVKPHGWGWAGHLPSIIFSDTGSANSYYDGSADTPSLYGWKLDGSNTKIYGGDALMNTAGPDNVATAVYMTSAAPAHVCIGLSVRAQSASFRWLRDYDSTIDSLHGAASAVIVTGATVNVVNPAATRASFPKMRVVTNPSDGDALSVRGSVGNTFFQVSTLSGAPGVFIPNGNLLRFFSDPATTETARIDASKGTFRPAQLTTTARNALTGLAAGDTVYDTTLHLLVTHDGTSWRNQAGVVV